jgi:uncharacterized protein (DUF1697 family)
MNTFVALLRGINVGGRNRLPMGELRAALSTLGLEDVSTYLQSGNVVFRSPGEGKQLAAGIEQRIAEVFGLKIAVLLRTPAELRKIAAGNPFLQDEADLAKLHVVFLDGTPTAAVAAKLDPDRSPPDRFSLRDRELYLHLPNGAGRSKLTIDYFERLLEVKATARNWKTLTKLIVLTRQSL